MVHLSKSLLSFLKMLFIGFAYEEKSKIENVFQEGLTELREYCPVSSPCYCSIKVDTKEGRGGHQGVERWEGRGGQQGEEMWAPKREEMGNKERRGGHQGGVLSYKPVEPFILHSQINQLNHLYSTVRKTSRTSYTPQTEKPVEPFILYCHTKKFYK